MLREGGAGRGTVGESVTGRAERDGRHGTGREERDGTGREGEGREERDGTGGAGRGGRDWRGGGGGPWNWGCVVGGQQNVGVLLASGGGMV